MEARGLNLKDLLASFSEVSNKRFSITLNLASLESIMKPIREGREELTQKHLNTIKQDWTFLKWWKIPEIEATEMNCLNEVFASLGPHDKRAITVLYNSFMNIEIVSCLLRFACPEYYGIFSPPVENLLNIRGEYQTAKYLNYLVALEELKEAYSFERIADVDMALWTLANILNSSKLRFDPRYHEIYESYPASFNTVKKIMARNSLAILWQERPPYLEMSALFLETDPEIAGVMLGKAIESFIRKRSKTNGIKEKLLVKGGTRYISLPEICGELVQKKDITKAECQEIGDWRDIRNASVHGSRIFQDETELEQIREKINEAIKGLSELMKRIEERKA